MTTPLDGYKTYIVAGVLIAVVLAESAGYIQPDAARRIEAIIVGLMGVTIRHALTRGK